MTDEAILEKRWQAATIRDNFIFGKTFETNPHLCKQLIENILNIKISKITFPEREKTLDSRVDSKGIRLDVYVEDATANRSFNIEMQVADNDNLGKRMRYYQGLIDLDKLKRGQHYSALGEVFIIFICPFRCFDGERHIYTFKNLCVEDSAVALNDGATKIFLSTKGKMKDVRIEIENFLNYVESGAVAGKFVEQLDNAVQIIKTNRKVRLDYVTYEMAILDRERRSRAEGRAEERSEMIKNFLAAGTPIEYIIKATGWTEEQILQLRQDQKH